MYSSDRTNLDNVMRRRSSCRRRTKSTDDLIWFDLEMMVLLFRHSNVLILTTSNITGVIDIAFLDRADVRQYIGLPSAGAVYQILHSCMQELIRVCDVLALADLY